jgi:hypothetical protein
LALATGGAGAVAVAAGAGAVGLGALAWRLSRRGKYIDKKTQELLLAQEEKRKREEEKNLVDLRESIFRGFNEIGSKDGLKELRELESEHKELIAVLHRIPEGADIAKLVSIGRIEQLAKDTYRQGLLALHRVWETMREVEPANRYSLEGNVEVLGKEIERLERSPAKDQQDLLKIKRERLASARERLDKINQQAIMVEKLLQQSDQCEAKLHQARLGVIELLNEGSGEKAEEVAQLLQNAIDTAKRVQEELKRFDQGISFK